jgi:septal ring factor EnvC (AmiA/AmiB activator)
MVFKFLVPLLILIASISFAQTDYDRDLKKNRQKLNSIKSEIDRLKKEISKIHIEESNIEKQLQILDKEMALIGQAKGLLVREQKLLNKKIDGANAQLETTKRRYNDLKKLYADRAIYAYKYGRVRNAELILTSQSLAQAFTRYKFLRLIAEHDERMMNSIVRKKQKIENIKADLDKNMNHMQANIKEKEREESNYLVRRSQRANLLKKMKWNESLHKKQLLAKETEREKLDNIIFTLERSRRVRERKGESLEQVYFDFDDFRKAKGKLPWPVRGKVVTKYGKVRDPKTKTTINNTDIEISSTPGSRVQSVFKGLVQMITYLPGYGNTVILDHGKGFYTVYSHLDEIYVEKGEFIDTGYVLATVRQSNSTNNSRLGFGIYGGNETYNPVTWLR